MSQYQAEISWQRAANETFIDKRYSRAHQWQFDGGITLPASPQNRRCVVNRARASIGAIQSGGGKASLDLKP
jgi:hypothetical protein